MSRPRKFHVERSSSATHRSGRYAAWSTSRQPLGWLVELRGAETEDRPSHPDQLPRQGHPFPGASIARDVATSNAPRSPRPGDRSADAPRRPGRSIPVSRNAVRRNATFFPVASISVNRSFGRSSASGIAGRPAAGPDVHDLARGSAAPPQPAAIAKRIGKMIRDQCLARLRRGQVDAITPRQQQPRHTRRRPLHARPPTARPQTAPAQPSSVRSPAFPANTAHPIIALRPLGHPLKQFTIIILPIEPFARHR